MDSRIDLDAAALAITGRADRWRESGLTVGDVTWRDLDLDADDPPVGGVEDRVDLAAIACAVVA